ncbi:MAG: BamA/TamA family outer membrane protein, partial [Candidatus Krumholzibacteria bacterium]|nr:BamA/TamA family outer membrane protein [Candidatus Krumholzibacteria bacterium]
PDGREIAFFSERSDFFISLWIADVETGRIKRKLVKSGFSTDFESLRFIYSSGAFSPDGRWFALAAKRKEREDIVIIDARRGQVERRIRLPLNGVTSPNWSPDGRRLVFTGSDGGLSDLYIVNADGSGLERLTNDKFADLQPAWSPDGKTIAFTTDRGADTDFQLLRFGNMRIALYHLDTGTIEYLGHMEDGKNINPAWAPDGRSLAFISDRTGISNIFLYDFGDGEIYQLSNVITGITGITAQSPAMSWAAQADRLAALYYQDGEYDIYVVDNPRQLKKEPYRKPPGPRAYALLRRPGTDTAVAVAATPAAEPRADSVAAGRAAAGPVVPTPPPAASVYRAPGGFRASAIPQPAESTTAPRPVTVRELLDAAELALPDTLEFGFREYRTRFTPDYVAQPTIGYSYDNFNRGFYGGAAFSLSDMLGNKSLIFSGAINGRPQEAQILTAYVNQGRRLNWAVGFQQQPYYFYAAYTPPTPVNLPGGPGFQETVRLQRNVWREIFLDTAYPFSRFTRAEFGLRAVGIQEDLLVQDNFYDANGFYLGSPDLRTISLGSTYFAQPSVALVHDRTLFAYVGPFAGRRYRLQLSPSIGEWSFIGTLGDVRQYVYFRPFTVALRGIVFSRFGRDADRFPVFMGTTELIRGYTYSSIVNNECASSQGGCTVLAQLTGSKVAVANAELRFPLFQWLALGFLPVALPPIEAALFYDVGVAWNEGQSLGFSGGGPTVRTPLRSWGGSLRVNALGIMILRFDYTKPLDRSFRRAYWTVSFGPTF